MWFILRLALLVGAVAAVRALRGDAAAAVAALATGILLFAGPLWRGLGPRKRRRGAEDDGVAGERGPAGGVPGRAEFLAAGVDTRSCGRCRRPIRAASYFFALDGKPTVYCETCWDRAAPADDPVRRGQWMTRLSGGFERRGA